MNYIAEINRFHELLPQSRMTPSSIALWYGLMHIFNKAGWPDEMEIPLADIESNTKLSRYTIRRERLRLAEYELITYKRPESFLHGVYRILPLSGRILFKLESELGQNATTLVHSDTTQKMELVHKATTMVQDAPSQTTDTLFKENININNRIENNKRKSGSNSSPKSERSVKTSSKSKKRKKFRTKRKAHRQVQIRPRRVAWECGGALAGTASSVDGVQDPAAGAVQDRAGCSQVPHSAAEPLQRRCKGSPDDYRPEHRIELRRPLPTQAWLWPDPHSSWCHPRRQCGSSYRGSAVRPAHRADHPAGG